MAAMVRTRYAYVILQCGRAIPPAPWETANPLQRKSAPRNTGPGPCALCARAVPVTSSAQGRPCAVYVTAGRAPCADAYLRLVARTPRKALAGGSEFFHAYARGTGPIVIFRDEADYEIFVLMLRRTARRFGWNMFAYCLMPTHYHVVLETPLEQLSAGMHRLNGSYAMQFNRKHGRTGHLFQSRFSVRVIEDEAYLQRAWTYVHGNAARAGLCDEADEWPWAWSAAEQSPGAG